MSPSVTGDLSCFVICPIGNRLASIGSHDRLIWEDTINLWEDVIKPACDGLGLDVMRADQISEAGDITDQIFRRLRDSHVVIADLTGANANVMYELGLRHTTGKLTIQLGEDGRLPFDVNTIRSIIFRRTDAGLIEARRGLSRALSAGLEGRFSPVMATRVWLEMPATLDSLDVPHDSPDDLDDAPGQLEIFADMETALADMVSTIIAVGTVTKEVSEGLNAGVSRLNAAGGPNASNAIRLAIANEVSSHLQDPAARMEALATSFSDSVRRCDPGIRLAIDQIRGGVARDLNPPQVLTAIKDGSTALVAGLAAAEGFKDALVAGGNLTREFRRVTRRIVGAQQTLLAPKPLIEGWIARAEGSA